MIAGSAPQVGCTVDLSLELGTKEPAMRAGVEGSFLQCSDMGEGEITPLTPCDLQQAGKQFLLSSLVPHHLWQAEELAPGS